LGLRERKKLGEIRAKLVIQGLGIQDPSPLMEPRKLILPFISLIFPKGPIIILRRADRDLEEELENLDQII